MEAAKRLQFQSQTYVSYWPAVMLSECAEAKCRNLSILYASFPRMFNRTVTAVLEDLRKGATTQSKINVAEILAEEDVPAGVKFSYTMTESGLLVCDLWTPLQPQLFGV